MMVKYKIFQKENEKTLLLSEGVKHGKNSI